MELVERALPLALQWGLPGILIALECWMLLRLVCVSGLALYPAFILYLTIVMIALALRSVGFYLTHLIIHVCLIPIKVWCIYEAIRMRAIFLIQATPKKVEGETWLLGKSVIWVAVVTMVMACFVRLQYNVPQQLMRTYLVAQVGLTTVLVLSWGYFKIRSTWSPRRAETHHTLLTGWFLLFTLTNLVPAPSKGEELKWLVLNYGSLFCGILLMLCWLRLFRLVRIRTAVPTFVAPASLAPATVLEFSASPSAQRR